MTSFSPFAINLASQPFRRERATNALYLALCSVLSVTLMALVVLILHERSQAADLRRAIGREQANLQTVQTDQSTFSNILGKPQNADVFATSVFLNELIVRRAVSWTRVFKDLETVMPYNMRLQSVRLPLVAAQESGGVNHVQLDMLVGTERPETILDLLSKLQSSPLFGAAAVVVQQPPSQNEPLFRYRVTVAYAQKL